ncbi:MAG: CGNR zinc finger domain-containing protein [Chloroflexota bacterium]
MGAPTASAELEQLIEFVNTIDLEDARDPIGTPALFAAWLSQHGTHGPPGDVSAATHRRAIDLREGLRALGRHNNQEAAEPERLHALEAATAELPLIASLGTDSGWQLRPRAGGADAFLAWIVATAVRAMADGRWSRVKACQNDTCRWLFVDASRNRSRTWCTMATCGSRMKARAYRARQRPDA